MSVSVIDNLADDIGLSMDLLNYELDKSLPELDKNQDRFQLQVEKNYYKEIEDTISKEYDRLRQYRLFYQKEKKNLGEHEKEHLTAEVRQKINLAQICILERKAQARINKLKEHINAINNEISKRRIQKREIKQEIDNSRKMYSRVSTPQIAEPEYKDSASSEDSDSSENEIEPLKSVNSDPSEAKSANKDQSRFKEKMWMIYRSRKCKKPKKTNEINATIQAELDKGNHPSLENAQSDGVENEIERSDSSSDESDSNSDNHSDSSSDEEDEEESDSSDESESNSDSSDEIEEDASDFVDLEENRNYDSHEYDSDISANSYNEIYEYALAPICEYSQEYDYYDYENDYSDQDFYSDDD